MQLALFKICITCDEAKALEEFVADKRKPSGRRGRCKACQAAIDRQRERPSKPEQQRAWHAAHPGKRSEYQQRWEQKHPEQLRQIRERARDKRRARGAEAMAESLEQTVDALRAELAAMRARVERLERALVGTTRMMESYYRPDSRVYGWMGDIIDANRTTLDEK